MVTKIKSEEVFDSLVENAIDYIKFSLEQIESNSKRSIINFWAGIELFFKARLVKEHWSLLFSDVDGANRDKFNQGNFTSVNFKENILRLNNICEENISTDILDKIRKHRNKLIHFIHSDIENSSEKFTKKIVREQCQGWFVLKNLFNNEWEKVFEKYDTQINELDRKLKDSTLKYFHVKYQNIKDILENKINGGVKIIKCKYCNFKALEVISENTKIDLINKFKCHVCETEEEGILLNCPDCHNELLKTKFEDVYCKDCEKKIFADSIAYSFDRSPGIQDGDYRLPANCGECFNSLNTVIEYPKPGEYFCVECFLTFDHIEQCQYCGEYTTEKLEHSYITGCTNCSGKEIF